MTASTLTTIQSAHDAVCSEIAKLEAVKLALERAGASRGIQTPPKPSNPPKSQGKAPAGSLPTAILSVLDRKTPQANGAIRSALKAKGYPYSLSALHVTKTLIRLSASKKVRRVGKAPKVSYLLP